MGKYCVTHVSSVQFIDAGLYGLCYKEQGIKYYCIICDIKSIAPFFKHEFHDFCLVVSQRELDSLLSRGKLLYAPDSLQYQIL